MNISGLRPFEALDHFKVNNEVIAKAQADRISRMAMPEGKVAPKNESVDFGIQTEKPISQKMTVIDYAEKYNSKASFEMKGSDSDISKLDEAPKQKVEAKDSVLLQYQFYVGPKNSMEEEIQSTQNAKQLENFDF